MFFKSIGISNTENILNIKIEPIIDIYAFVNTSQAIAENAQNTQNFELMRLLAESEDINKVIEDEKTSKNYPHHKISIVTLNKIQDKEVIKPILKYLNSDEYLNKYRECVFWGQKLYLRRIDKEMDFSTILDDLRGFDIRDWPSLERRPICLLILRIISMRLPVWPLKRPLY